MVQKKNSYYRPQRNNKNQNAPDNAAKENNAGKLNVQNDEVGEFSVIASKELVRPITATDNPEDTVEVNFDNADLQNIISWLGDTFKINIISDDIISPLQQGAKAIAGNKITFKTQKPMTKKDVWDLSLTLLDLFGLTITAGTLPNFYKVSS